jgi:hypothetical protein
LQEEGEVDIEGSDVEGSCSDSADSFEEYEWAGQTRVRATSLLGGAYAESGFTMVVREPVMGKCGEEELNIDGDETDVYGPAQYPSRKEH